MWDSASWIVGSNGSPGAPNLVSPSPATTRSSCSATAWKPSSSGPCSRARSIVSSTSVIGASAAYVAFSRTSSRSRSTRRL